MTEAILDSDPLTIKHDRLRANAVERFDASLLQALWRAARADLRAMPEPFVCRSHAWLARKLRCGERTVRAALARLEARGLIRRTHQPLATGGRKPDLIAICHSSYDKLPDTRARAVTTRTGKIIANRRDNFAASILRSGNEDLLLRSRDDAQTASRERGEPMARSSSPSSLLLFPDARTRQKRAATVPTWRDGYAAEFDAPYRERYGRACPVGNWGRLARDYKRWTALVPDAAVRLEMTREYLRSTETYLEAHGHAFHLMLQHGRVAGLVARATSRIEERKARDKRLQFHAEMAAREKARMAEADAADHAAAAAAGQTVDEYRKARTAYHLRRMREINLYGKARA